VEARFAQDAGPRGLAKLDPCIFVSTRAVDRRGRRRGHHRANPFRCRLITCRHCRAMPPVHHLSGPFTGDSRVRFRDDSLFVCSTVRGWWTRQSSPQCSLVVGPNKNESHVLCKQLPITDQHAHKLPGAFSGMRASCWPSSHLLIVPRAPNHSLKV